MIKNVNGSTESVAFFQALFAAEDHIMIRPIETWIEKNRKQSRVDWKGIQYATGETINTVFPFVNERSESQKTNIFYGVCPRFGNKGQYEKKWQIRTVRCLWADIDDTADVDQVKNRCWEANLPEPSVIVHSGNGVHVYWLLDEPYLIDDAGDPPPVHTEWTETSQVKRNGQLKKLKREYIVRDGERLYLDKKGNEPALSPKAMHIENILKGIAAKIGGDHTTDLCRILRVPGTWNRKDQRNGKEPLPCRLVKCEADEVHSIDDFSPFAESAPITVEQAQPKLQETTPLPRGKGLLSHSQRKRDEFNQHVAKCAVAATGYRSEADFSLCCWSIRNGIDKEDVRRAVADVGKFKERGDEYFDRTWQKAEGEVRLDVKVKIDGIMDQCGGGDSHNDDGEDPASSEEDQLNDHVISNGFQYEGETPAGEAKIFTDPLAINAVVKQIRTATNDWPRIANGSMFVRGSDGVDWLEKIENYYGFLHSVKPVRWHAGPLFVSRAEARAEHMRHCPRYKAIEHYPHEPMLDGHFYVCDPVKPGDGATLNRFLDFFCPETPIDRDLIQSALMTMAWGGPGGKRPLFLITAKGRGFGKTTTAESLASIFGGTMAFSMNDKSKDIKDRLLSPEALAKRAALLDNVKTTKISNGDIEALVTASEISGKRMYVGEASRPNTITWFVTVNGASLSKDMAQRSVPIHVARPNYSGDWDADMAEFVEQNRTKIIADIVASMRGPSYALDRYSRWGLWERDILEKLPEPNEAQAVIRERQGALDTDAEEASGIVEHFRDRLEDLHYDVDTNRVMIPTKVCVQWLADATSKPYNSTSGTQTLKQLIDEGDFPWLRRNTTKNYGRGFIWEGPKADVAETIRRDVEERLQRETRKDAWS